MCIIPPNTRASQWKMVLPGTGRSLDSGPDLGFPKAKNHFPQSMVKTLRLLLLSYVQTPQAGLGGPVSARAAVAGAARGFPRSSWPVPSRSPLSHPRPRASRSQVCVLLTALAVTRPLETRSSHLWSLCPSIPVALLARCPQSRGPEGLDGPDSHRSPLITPFTSSSAHSCRRRL